jgi:hypothetical protein
VAKHKADLPDEIVTKKLLPVLIGGDYDHVMAKATIRQTPDSVIIEIVAENTDAYPYATELTAFLTQAEIVALSFGGVPIRPPSKEKHDT